MKWFKKYHETQCCLKNVHMRRKAATDILVGINVIKGRLLIWTFCSHRRDYSPCASSTFIASNRIHHTLWVNLSARSPTTNDVPDKVAFLRLFSLINMFWLAEQSHRQTETCRISGASGVTDCFLYRQEVRAFMRAVHWFPNMPGLGVQRKERLPVEKNAVPVIWLLTQLLVWEFVKGALDRCPFFLI